MGTVASTARIKLTGFNTEGVDAYSPLEDQVALTYRAAYHFASANGFKPYVHRGIAGRAGPMVMKRITDSLFDHADKEVRDKINGLVSQVLRKTDAAVCVVHPADRETLPTWFVADKMPPNLTIVALSHVHNDKRHTEPTRLVPTRTEQRLTAQEAGETMTPGEVTVKQTDPQNPPKKILTPEERIAPLREHLDRIAAEHKEFLEELYRLIAAHAPIGSSELKFLMGKPDSDGSAIVGSVKELADAGRIVGRIEDDPERLIRGGGSFPKGKRITLWAPAPGPVPKRTALPEGVPVRRGAKDWAKEYSDRLDSMCDKILTVMNTRVPVGQPRVKSLGRIAEASGLTVEETKLALQRLISLDLVYKGDNSGNYHLSERRRVRAVKPLPPQEVTTASQEPSEVQLVAPPSQPANQEATVAPANQDLVADVVALIERHTKTGEYEELREQLRLAQETVARQAKIITSLRGAIAAMEE